MGTQVEKITVKGFKSIQNLTSLALNPLNIIVGANGAGKSNFVQIFDLLPEMMLQNLQGYVLKHGGADAFPFDGWEETPKIEIMFEFGDNSYGIILERTADGQLLLQEQDRYRKYSWNRFNQGSLESKLESAQNEHSSMSGERHGVHYDVYNALSKWTVYHFHNTSLTAGMRRPEIADDNEKLRRDGSNIAPYLFHLQKEHQEEYADIVNAIRLVMPYFDGFRFKTESCGDAEKIKLTWKQKGIDYPMQTYHLSDGTIRFICLATALLQPDSHLPSTIVIDEPELGLHPEAIGILAELLKSASQRMQIIVTTQSPLLLDQFAIDDIIVSRREKGASSFVRLKESDYRIWLEDFTPGDLWAKNVIEGGTTYE